MKTSARGLAFLERHEGVVLRAYRCPAGVWTIGAGLTAASGVVTPKAGMVISRDDASALLAQALERSYEPAVARVMRGATGAEFDAGVSFHFNTGAIARASWVKLWRAVTTDWPAVRRALLLWNKGGGKVLPGLTRRREEEYALLHGGIYHGVPDIAPASGLARIVVPFAPAELAALRQGLSTLGYTPGPDLRGVLHGAVQSFQHDHALTADGVVGKATLSTLQRVLDSRRKAVGVAPVAAVGGLEAGSDKLSDLLGGLPWVGEVVLGLIALRLAWLAFTYRDTVAAAVASHFPRLANALRSF